MKNNIFLRAISLSSTGEYFTTNNELVRDFKRQGYSMGKISAFEHYLKYFCDLVYADDFNPRDRNHVPKPALLLKKFLFWTLFLFQNLSFLQRKEN